MPVGLPRPTEGIRETVSPDGTATEADEAQPAASGTPMLDKFGTDLTALAESGDLDPVIGRVDEIEQTIEILARRTKNNPVWSAKPAWARPPSLKAWLAPS